ncbi:diguanylate cyclase [Aliidiomarina sanyensis]|uniref:GGDEF domain-containing protein n=1 Tax=Aliidiomarina sanyensis TaxID=1249555 RepID=A0A432WNF8_9GAMM|nr:diguanylate cyclase [Aliidiomarina sanyensis]RUO35227.1 GGDEF domain-containing protein [Aliidiomarina sanyensis]
MLENKRWHALLWVVVSTIFISAYATAQNRIGGDGVAVSDRFEVYPLDMRVSMLRDPSRRLDFAQVRERPDDFVLVNDRRQLQLNYTDEHVWLRTDILNMQPRQATWYLQFEYPLLAHLTVYVEKNGSLDVMNSGVQVPQNQRAMRGRLHTFPITIDAGESARIYVQARSDASMTLFSALLSERAYAEQNNRQNFWLSIHFGMIIALSLYNLLLFSGVREKVFLLYSVFVMSFGVGTLAANGLGTLILLDSATIATERVVSIAFMLSALFGTLFVRTFLDTRRYQRGWHFFLTILAVGVFLAIGGSLFLELRHALILMDFVGFSTCLILFACGIQFYRRGVSGAGLFVLAWSILLTGASLFALRNLGILPSNFITLYGIQIGSAIEMLLLSFALVARVNKLKRQKEEAQSRVVATLKAQEAVLESKVAQRTRDLEIMANSDTLTGLLNRNGLTRHLKSAIKRCQREERALTLFMLDLDQFKPINDQYGHDAGDYVLQRIAQRIQESARGNDAVARFGGDEFIVVTENIQTKEDIEAVKRRLKRVITHPIQIPGGDEVSVGVSIGHCIAEAPSSINELLRKADAAMYTAKHKQG